MIKIPDMSALAPTPDATKSPWLVSPMVDILIGAGGIYLIIAFALGLTGRADMLDATTAACIALAIGGPHYGATLLKAYGTAQARAQFKTIGTYGTAALIVAVAASLWLPMIGAWLVTIYFTWVAYHYAAQSYGVARMLLARRNVAVDNRVRYAFQAVFVTSAMLWVVSIHTELSTRLPVSSDELYPLLRLGIPVTIGTAILIALGLAMIGCLAYVAIRFAAASSLRRAGLAMLLTLGQMTWFAIPVLAIRSGLLGTWVPFASDTRANMFLFIAFTHSSQYLWVALYHAKKQQGGTGATHFLRALAAGSLVWAVPALLLSHGPVPTELGVAILVAAAVNIHHFALDGVVWKLRDPKNAALVSHVAAAAPQQRGELLIALGAVALALQLVGVGVDRELRILADEPDGERVALIEPVARFIGHDGPSLRTARIAAEVAAGHCDAASRAFDEIPPHWTVRAQLQERVDRCAETPRLSMAPSTR